MAPALSVASQDPFDAIENFVKPPPRRALASVDNFSSHMEEDMGLQNQPSLAKDSQEMEQILVDLGSSDLAQADLLQAIKTLESGGDALSTGDPDVIFPLSGFDLNETVDSEGDATPDDKIRLQQARLERRCAFLQRRLRILQARAIGKKISEEAAHSFEKATRGARKDGGGRPMGLKALLKKVETTATLQASAASRTVVGPKYYRASTSKGDASRSASIGIPSGTLAGLEDTAGALRSHLSMVKSQLDSDATASSSGAESNDEAVTYNNPHQQQMAIEKRALWTWQKARASIASRWCWLQAQVQELEYKIRQHNELHKQVREAKGPVLLEGEPVGYEGSLPGDDSEIASTCARVRPLRRDTFKKRKLLQMHNLHIATPKAAKPSDIKCSCRQPVESCAVCTGRAEATQPQAWSTLSAAQRLALVDPGYHPVLSDARDISPSVHMAALSSRAWFRSRCNKAWRGAHHSGLGRTSHAPHAHAHTPHSHAQPTHTPPTNTVTSVKKHPTRLKRGRPPLSRKIKEREREDENSTSGKESRARGRSSTETRAYRRPSYDIDNIVIPQSIAANTRPEILTYKEIITPKWRVMEIPDAPLNNGVMKSNRISMESEEEDISEAAVEARHTRAEVRERNRYMRKQRTRRSQHEDPATPPLPPPAPPAPPPQPAPPALPDPPLSPPAIAHHMHEASIIGTIHTPIILQT
ncbi:KAT8 regulatory NSL complex subunit 1 isoform X1 [Battus philenor]|uniref:KAT8 regulatory NSL complex subunit 1 isoform X1 n=1 Tax=Battus philenor TaxID=42288 RepID=UPI0035CF4D7A